MDQNSSRRKFFMTAVGIGGIGLSASLARSSLAEAATNPSTAADAPFVNVKDFGALGNWNPTNGTGQDDTSYIKAANNYAVSVGKSVYFPSGKYLFQPSTITTISTTWRGENVQTTMLYCNPTKYTGEFFRVTATAEISDLYILNSLANQKGIGLHIGSATTATVPGVTSMVRLTRVWVTGFDYNIQCDSSFMLHFDGVRSQGGTEGFWCNPANTGNSTGFITTHVHTNCYYSGNIRNVVYSTPVISNCVTFINCAIQDMTGTVYQSCFINVQDLQFSGCYFEGTNKPPATYPAVRLSGCTTRMESCYFAGTAGIDCATDANRLTLKNINVSSGSDVLIMNGGSNQYLTLDNTTLAATGNLVTVGTMKAVNSSFNGNSFGDYNVNLPLQINDGNGANTLHGLDSFTISVGATNVAANSSAALAIDIYKANVMLNGAAFAMLTVPIPGITLQAAPANTGSNQYYSVYAVNGTGTAATIPAQSIRIVVFRFAS